MLNLLKKPVRNTTLLYWTTLFISLYCLFLWYGMNQLSLEVSRLGVTNENTIKTHSYDGTKLSGSVIKDEESLRPAGAVGKLVKTSCYTSEESHGANGRNKWSVATYLYPQGTKVFIEGIGEKVVETVTSRKYADRLDIWFGEDWEGCKEYGLQMKQVWVLDK